MNNRAAIREAVKDMLLSNTDAGTNVYSTQNRTFWREELPIIVIYTSNESSTQRAIGSNQYIRTLDIKIEMKLESTGDVDDDLDDLVGQVEDLISADGSLNGTVNGTILTSTELTVDTSGNKPVGHAILSYVSTYIS